MRVWVSLLLLMVAAAPCLSAFGQERDEHYDAQAVRIERLAGRLRVEIAREGPIQLRLEGSESELEQVKVSVVDGVLVVRQEGRNWSFMRLWRDPVRLALVVPQGTPLAINDMTGETWIGDTLAKLSLDLRGGDARIGRVADATIRFTGRGDVTLAEVSGALNVTLVGSGDVAAGSANQTTLKIEGSGDIKLGTVTGPFKAAITGSGDVTATEINGPLDLEINGSGRVRAFRGELPSARIVINGSGSFEFDGLAVEPDIVLRGNGSVEIRAVRGTYKTERLGNGEIRLGRD
jgi:hypothetical protein